MHKNLLSTNIIENSIRNMRGKLGRVTRWREETDQPRRWLAMALIETEKRIPQARGLPRPCPGWPKHWHANRRPWPMPHEPQTQRRAHGVPQGLCPYGATRLPRDLSRLRPIRMNEKRREKEKTAPKRTAHPSLAPRPALESLPSVALSSRADKEQNRRLMNPMQKSL